MGQPAVLVAYDMAPLTFQTDEYHQYFPIFGPLGASIGGQLGATIDFAFGDDGEISAKALSTSSDPAGGADRIYGGAGQDILFGGGGADIIEGGDTTQGIETEADGDSSDVLIGDGGSVRFPSAEVAKIVENIFEVVDTLRGVGYNDILFGNGGPDTIFGGPGND